MNLAEFPLTVLSSRVDPKLKTLEFTDQLRTKTGELVERKWIITAADKFGLPVCVYAAKPECFIQDLDYQEGY